MFNLAVNSLAVPMGFVSCCQNQRFDGTLMCTCLMRRNFGQNYNYIIIPNHRFDRSTSASSSSPNSTLPLPDIIGDHMNPGTSENSTENSSVAKTSSAPLTSQRRSTQRVRKSRPRRMIHDTDKTAEQLAQAGSRIPESLSRTDGNSVDGSEDSYGEEEYSHRESCIFEQSDGVKHILKIKQHFPASMDFSALRDHLIFSWDRQPYEEEDDILDDEISEEDEWRNAGSQLRAVADCFEQRSKRIRSSAGYELSLPLFHRYMSTTFGKVVTVSILGLIAMRIHSKLS